MYRLTAKTHEILDLIGYNLDRVFHSSSNQGWVIGKTHKFIALGMTKQEGVEKGFLTIHPLYKLCEKNEIIPEDWLDLHLTQEQLDDFYVKSIGSTKVEEGFYSRDVQKYLRLTGL